MKKVIAPIRVATCLLSGEFAADDAIVDTGQDSDYSINPPSYRDNGDGTISDLVTGLMWTQDPGEKMTYAQAVDNAANVRVGGYDDWRLPTIKKLYSLINFSGVDPGPRSAIGYRWARR